VKPHGGRYREGAAGAVRVLRDPAHVPEVYTPAERLTVTRRERKHGQSWSKARQSHREQMLKL
jgi:hypothetical protein